MESVYWLESELMMNWIFCLCIAQHADKTIHGLIKRSIKKTLNNQALHRLSGHVGYSLMTNSILYGFSYIATIVANYMQLLNSSYLCVFKEYPYLTVIWIDFRSRGYDFFFISSNSITLQWLAIFWVFRLLLNLEWAVNWWRKTTAVQLAGND